jgi:hypothetical protein
MNATKYQKYNQPFLFTKRNANTDHFGKKLALFKTQAQLMAHSLGTVVAFINPAARNRIARLHEQDYAANEADDSSMLNYLKTVYSLFRLMGKKSLHNESKSYQFNICNVNTQGAAAVSDEFLYNALFDPSSKHTAVFISYGLPNASHSSTRKAIAHELNKTRTAMSRIGPSAAIAKMDSILQQAEADADDMLNLNHTLITGLCVISNASVMERNDKKKLFWRMVHNIDGAPPVSEQELEQVNRYYGAGKLADLLVICAQPKSTPLSHPSKHTAFPLLLQSLAKIAGMKEKRAAKYKGVIVEASRGKNKNGETYIPAQQLLEKCGFKQVKIKLHALLDEDSDENDADLNSSHFDMTQSTNKTVTLNSQRHIQDYFVLFDEHNGQKWFEKINIFDHEEVGLCPFGKEGLWAKYPYCI